MTVYVTWCNLTFLGKFRGLFFFYLSRNRFSSLLFIIIKLEKVFFKTTIAISVHRPSQENVSKAWYARCLPRLVYYVLFACRLIM